jgi:hypothetical protein
MPGLAGLSNQARERNRRELPLSASFNFVIALLLAFF